MSKLTELLDAKKEVEAKAGACYFGDFRLVSKNAQPIKRIGNEYFPASDDDIAELEYQVSQGRVTKEVI